MKVVNLRKGRKIKVRNKEKIYGNLGRHLITCKICCILINTQVKRIIFVYLLFHKFKHQSPLAGRVMND